MNRKLEFFNNFLNLNLTFNSFDSLISLILYLKLNSIFLLLTYISIYIEAKKYILGMKENIAFRFSFHSFTSKLKSCNKLISVLFLSII